MFPEYTVWAKEYFYNYGIIFQDAEDIFANSLACSCTSENINSALCSPELEIKNIIYLNKLSMKTDTAIWYNFV